jgi:D-alanyl-D-alanine dipeptidase
MKRLAWLLVPLTLLTACSAQPAAEPVEETPSVVIEEPLPAEEETLKIEPETDEPKPEPADTDLVRVIDYAPDIAVDLRYATAENFTGQVIYDFTDAYLRYGTVKKLISAQETLAEQGYGLKIWDAFRPTSAQFTLWNICPDGNYVADPNRGFSSHSRGNTVDVTLAALDGTEVPMPTGFDDFTAKADRDYSDVDAEAAANGELLEEAMVQAGFQPYAKEWWHFSDTDSYDVEETLPEGAGNG